MLKSTLTGGSYVLRPSACALKLFDWPAEASEQVRFMDPSTTVANELGSFPNLFVCRTSGLGGFRFIVAALCAEGLTRINMSSQTLNNLKNPKEA